MIKEFRGSNYFLSNFSSIGNIEINGFIFSNGETAFHSFKDLSKQAEFRFLTPSEAKRLGRKVKLRADWEIVKDDIMYQVIKAKFTQNETLKVKLLNTGNEKLVEGNTWHDNYWGSCICPRCQGTEGRNQLGKTLMKVRLELRDL